MFSRHYVKIASYSKALIRNNILLNKKCNNGLLLHNLSRNIHLSRLGYILFVFYLLENTFSVHYRLNYLQVTCHCSQ